MAQIGIAASFEHAALPPLSFLRTSRKMELASYLADFTLGTDTTAGALALQKLAEAHHCGATLTVEPYEGLRKVREHHERQASMIVITTLTSM